MPGDSSMAGLGPFHGNNEGMARVFVWLLAVEGLLLLVFPWVLVRMLSLHHHHFSRDPFLGMPDIFFRLGCMDFVGVSAALSFWTLWVRLSAKVAEGGSDAAFLDKTRLHVTTLMQIMVALGLLTIVFLDLGK